jgi:hypothetical protein
METTMILDMNDYRQTEGDFEDNAQPVRRRARGNTAAAPQLAEVEPETWLNAPELPEMDEFDDIDAREFIERVYGMATQI